MKIGAVRNPEDDNIGVVFEFTPAEWENIVSVSPLKYKKVLTGMFSKNIEPRKVLKALALAVKTLRRGI